ncbi:hypothetical protein D6D13_08131 [Aureobasidium pullulans]|uniref:Uncharacterized protein n=1 Tax=Aureobasidium pullulans TaxID=5580 RepID=A0A4S9C7I8_AURPU|nr:hypothetical protein D6D13_08131 [Aureobasidium pullulans]
MLQQSDSDIPGRQLGFQRGYGLIISCGFIVSCDFLFNKFVYNFFVVIESICGVFFHNGFFIYVAVFGVFGNFIKLVVVYFVLLILYSSKTEVPTSSIPTIDTITTSSSSAAATSPESKRDWTGVGIGVGVGIAVPLLAILIAGPLLWRRYRRRQVFELSDDASSRIVKESSIRSTVKPEYLKRYDADAYTSYELDAMAGRAEMPMKSPRELPGSEGERQRYQAYHPGVSSHPPRPE